MVDQTETDASRATPDSSRPAEMTAELTSPAATRGVGDDGIA